MIQLYSQGISEYLKALNNQDEQQLRNIIREIGIESLAENADWVAYNRANAIDIPLG
jgi:hypothetical protein